MKNVREYFKECFESEKPRFLRVMRAVPTDKGDYRPHPRSTSAGDLGLAAGERAPRRLRARGPRGRELRSSARPDGSGGRHRLRTKRGGSPEATPLDRRRPMEHAGEVPGGRQCRVGNVAGRHAVRLSLRCDPSSRPALELPAADGRQGAGDCTGRPRTIRACDPWSLMSTAALAVFSAECRSSRRRDSPNQLWQREVVPNVTRARVP